MNDSNGALGTVGTRNGSTTTRLRRTTATTSDGPRTASLPILPPSTITIGSSGTAKNSIDSTATFHSKPLVCHRWIGICIMASLLSYIVVQYRLTLFLHSLSLSHSRYEIRHPQSKQNQWEICDPLQNSNDLCGNNMKKASHFLLYNNSFDRTRYVCGNLSVPARSHIIVPASTFGCYDDDDDDTQHVRGRYHHQVPWRLFDVPPLDVPTNIDGRTRTRMPDHSQSTKSVSPVRVRFGRQTPRELFPNCDIPCYHDGEPISNRYVDIMDGSTVASTWTIEFSMEGPQYWSTLYINPQAWRENRFWSTTSYKSEIPLPYYSDEVFSIWHNDYVPYNTGIKGGAFLATNCDSKNRREELVKEMINHQFRVDAIGPCLHNAKPPNGLNNELSDKVSIMKQYLFYLAFENQCEDDYITEKLWGAYEAGTIPIYYGAPNVKDHVPNNSLIHVNAYNTTYELVQHLMAILDDPKLYESYHVWRTQPIPAHFHTKYDFTATHSTCRTCRWAYSRMYGIGWNHTAQSLRPLHIGFSRQVCLSSLLQSNSNKTDAINYLVQHPFVEEWYDTDGRLLSVEPTIISSDAMVDNSTECRHPLMNANRAVDIDHGKVQRMLYNHDGVVDLIVRKGTAKGGTDRLVPQSPIRLRLHFPLLQAPVRLRNIRSGVWHIQNEKSRFTILIASSFAPSGDVVVVKETDATYDVIVATPIRLRVIVEDVDTFHEGASEVENFFGKLLADDFFNPVQVSICQYPTCQT